MVSECQTLERVVDRGPNFPQSRLNGATADRAEKEPDRSAENNEGEIGDHEGKKPQVLVASKTVAQAADGVAQNLRQSHFDGDVDQQQPEAERHTAGML